MKRGLERDALPTNRRHPGQSIAVELRALGRLGFGTLSHPQIEAWISRSILFAEMEQLCKSELQRLRDACLPAYAALLATGRRMFPDLGSDFPVLEIRRAVPNGVEERLLDVDTWASLRTAATHYGEARQVEVGLREWADRHHLAVNWFLDAALINITGWANSRNSDEMSWGYPGGLHGCHRSLARFGSHESDLFALVVKLASQVVAPATPVYDPARQSRQEHLALVCERLTPYYGEVESVFRRAGFRPTTQKRKRSAPDRWLHIKWFVRYQIQGWSASKMADRTSENAIHRAVAEVARTLQVPLRSRG